MMLRLLLSAAIPITLLFGTATAQAQTTWHVDIANCPGPGSGTKADPFCKIQAGIDAATDGDEVLVAMGTYYETIDFNGKTISLRSTEGPEVTVIDGKRTGTVVRCVSGEGPETTLQGFTVTGGNGGNGGGMFVHGSSSATIVDCVFRSNISAFGGGMWCQGPATVTGCRFEENTGATGGGAIFRNSTVSNCVFSNNVATGRGAGIMLSGAGTIADSLFIENSAVSEGGAITIEGSNTNQAIVGCMFSGNLAFTGAGIFLGIGSGASTMLTDCLFVGNSATTSGGGMHINTASSATVAGCTFVNNASNTGGGMYNHFNSDTAVSDSLFCSNVPDDISGPYEDGGGNQFPKQCPATGACCVKGVCAVLTPALCTSVKGVYQGDDAACEEATCSQECPADLDYNGTVGAFDLALLLGAWGPCP